MSVEVTAMPFSGMRPALYAFAALPILIGIALIITGIVVIVKYRHKGDK